VELIVIIAGATLLWLIWQLIKAKRFTRFKQLLEQEIKPKVIAHIEAELKETRSDLLPNSTSHIQATIYFWSQYKVRILQAALMREIIDEKWLKETGNWRNSQHLFFIERDKKAK
jgi:hypothetical protein